MSFHSITIDHLMKLDKGNLEYALRMFQKELDGTLALLREAPDAGADEVVLTDLNHLLTLRKVFKLRLEELALEAQLAEVTVKMSAGSSPLAA